MSLTIYKISSYVNWKSTDGIVSGGGGNTVFPPIDLSQYYTKIELQTAGLSVVNWDNITGYPYTFVDSVQEVADEINLVGDEATPGGNHYYGTNITGTKGWHPLVAGSLAPQNNILYWNAAENWYQPYPAKPTPSTTYNGSALYNWYAVRGVPVQTPTLALEITYDNAVNIPYATVADWNTFFDLPNFGHVFTSLVIDGALVKLYGGSQIIIKDRLFYQNFNIVKIDDKASCVIEIRETVFYDARYVLHYKFPAVTIIGKESFGNNGLYTAPVTIDMPFLETAGNSAFAVSTFYAIDFPRLKIANTGVFSSVTASYISLPLLESAGELAFSSVAVPTISLPNLITIGNTGFYFSQIPHIVLPQCTTLGDYCFYGCTLLTYLSIPKVTAIGATSGDDQMFHDIISNTISLIIPTALAADGDVAYLQANNTVTLTLT
jgi:hypothetical protein